MPYKNIEDKRAASLRKYFAHIKKGRCPYCANPTAELIIWYKSKIVERRRLTQCYPHMQKKRDYLKMRHAI